jgi:hypothetical protein
MTPSVQTIMRSPGRKAINNGSGTAFGFKPGNGKNGVRPLSPRTLIHFPHVLFFALGPPGEGMIDGCCEISIVVDDSGLPVGVSGGAGSLFFFIGLTNDNRKDLRPLRGEGCSASECT